MLSKKIILTLLAVLVLSSCASKDEKLAQSSEQQLYQTAQKALNSSNWDSAISYLEALEEHYPFGNYAEQGQLELIYAYFRNRDYELVIAAADRFIRLHPQHRNVDYAYYMRGVSSFYNDTGLFAFLATDVTKRDPGTAREAFDYFSQMLNRYPESLYAPDARMRMLYLRNMLARYEIHVANYYFKRGAYLAAANRGRYVVENFQTTPAVPDGLAVMAQAYFLLGMTEHSENASRVLATNFPDHPALNEDGSFDYEYSTEQKKSWVSYATLGLFDKKPSLNFDTRQMYDPFFNRDVPEPPNS